MPVGHNETSGHLGNCADGEPLATGNKPDHSGIPVKYRTVFIRQSTCVHGMVPLLPYGTYDMCAVCPHRPTANMGNSTNNSSFRLTATQGRATWKPAILPDAGSRQLPWTHRRSHRTILAFPDRSLRSFKWGLGLSLIVALVFIIYSTKTREEKPVIWAMTEHLIKITTIRNSCTLAFSHKI